MISEIYFVESQRERVSLSIAPINILHRPQVVIGVAGELIQDVVVHIMSQLVQVIHILILDVTCEEVTLIYDS